MNEKQQQLLFDKGISNVPSDAVCDDNCLEESMNIVYRDGEHQPIQEPVLDIEVRDHNGVDVKDVLFIHKTITQSNYITFLDGGNLAWGIKSGNQYVGKGLLGVSSDNSENIQVEAVGNILIVKIGDTVNYFPWDADGYQDVVQKIPIPKVKFHLQDLTQVQSWNNNNENMADYDGPTGMTWLMHQETVRNVLYGMYYENRNNHHRNKRFVCPFTVRYALELYDGTLTYISNPIMLFPSYTFDSIIFWAGGGGSWYMRTEGWKLAACIEEGYDEKWKSLINGIAVYVSREVNLYNFIETWTPNAQRVFDASYYDHIAGVYGWHDDYSEIGHGYPVFHPFPDLCVPHADVIKELAENGVFYKLCDIPVYNNQYVGQFKLLDDLFSSTTLENLEVQQKLQNDDFYSYANTSANHITTYNNRLLLAGIVRSAFEGFSHFTGHQDDFYNLFGKVAIVTYLRIDGVECRVKKLTRSNSEIYGIWYYYPDTRAYRMEVWEYSSTDNKWGRADVAELRQHPNLNGAYAYNTDDWILRSKSGKTDSRDVKMSVAEMDAIPETYEEALPTEFALSEVNNPFVFNAIGYNRVGGGDILGLSNYTTALSQGQFGQFPIIIFSTEGTWAASLNSEGVVNSVYPMSREVCNNPDSITQTDGAVFFSSEKGLMRAVENKVICVSEQLRGHFPTFLKNARIAYDYRDSLLWIILKDISESYIYNIKTGTIHKCDYFYSLDKKVERKTSIVNNYPDTMLFKQGNGLYSLLNRPQPEDDEKEDYSGTLITRPMKLENALALKSIMQLRNIYDFSKGASMKLRIYASNNLDTDQSTWVELSSLRGKPWKYYKFHFEMSNMKATDRFAGTMLVTQERRTNKLR